MIVAYTKAAERGNKRKFKNPGRGILKPDTYQHHVAHIPEGTGYTLCGKRVAQTADVEEDADITPCQTCKHRLEGISRKHPERLGNFLLPAPNM